MDSFDFGICCRILLRDKNTCVISITIATIIFLKLSYQYLIKWEMDFKTYQLSYMDGKVLEREMYT